MTKDPLIACLLLILLVLTGASTSMQFMATSKLAKWLCRHRPQLWRELGCPGTAFFKGDPDNGYFSRTFALSNMHRAMPLDRYERQLVDHEPQRYRLLYRLGRGLGVIFMGLAAAVILWGIARDRSRQASLRAHPPNTVVSPHLFSNGTVPNIVSRTNLS